MGYTTLYYNKEPPNKYLQARSNGLPHVFSSGVPRQKPKTLFWGVPYYNYSIVYPKSLFGWFKSLCRKPSAHRSDKAKEAIVTLHGVPNLTPPHLQANKPQNPKTPKNLLSAKSENCVQTPTPTPKAYKTPSRRLCRRAGQGRLGGETRH